MSLRVSERVHIVPLGYEEQRVYEPAIELKADHVIILDHNDNEDEEKVRGYRATVEKELEQEDIECTFRTVDLFDLYGVLGAVSDIITQKPDDDIFVNLATGSKVSAIGGMIACMATGNATPYYVRARDYDGETPADTKPATELPAYPIEAPEPEQVRVLAYLSDEGSTTKRDLIKFGDEAGLPFVANHDVEEFKAKYRLLDNYIIDPLEERGYVELFKRGRKKYVEITELGDDTRRGFEYLIK